MDAKKGSEKRWYEVTLWVPTLWEEVLPGLLEDMGFSAMWVDTKEDNSLYSRLKAYLPEELWHADLEEKLKGHLTSLSDIFSKGTEKGEIRVRLITEEDWASQWLPFFTPIRLGPVWIRPQGKPVTMATGETEIILNPGQAFGTGHHETTQLCLKALLAVQGNVKKSNPILDLGTGSGILAMFAVKLGFSNILAVDVDPVAIETARKNLATNGINEGKAGPVHLTTTPLMSIDGRFSLIMANLTTKDLLPLAQIFEEKLVPGGCVIVSGILVSERDQVRLAFCTRALKCMKEMKLRDWACLVFSKNKK